ncbi:hypothetical protein NDU88_003141 [Pleurodeles waltl]|uniref:Uncharacterized protein n=1 Tax=Pleurodeles waltl TaxID=8319 RepID=A0AAV7RFE7_PLEWA|nr:hypothetical protein NDU88_003141 [Pleurodeles waltl]
MVYEVRRQLIAKLKVQAGKLAVLQQWEVFSSEMCSRTLEVHRELQSLWDTLSKTSFKSYRQLLHREGDRIQARSFQVLRCETDMPPIRYIRDALQQLQTRRRNISTALLHHLQVVYRAGLQGSKEEINGYLTRIGLPQFHSDLVQELEEDLSIEELAEALKAFNRSKALGGDEFPAEFH